MWMPAPDTESVESFRRLCREEFGAELSVEDAREGATRLILIYLMQQEAGPREAGEEETSR